LALPSARSSAATNVDTMPDRALRYVVLLLAISRTATAIHRSMMEAAPHAESAASAGLQTHNVSASARVIVVVPIHPPKFPWMCQLMRSAFTHPDLPVLPVFAEEAAKAEFVDAFGESLLHPTGYMVVEPPKSSKRPIVYKKFVAIWRVFVRGAEAK